jgi:hypothetical protein
MHRTAAGAWEDDDVRAAALEVQKGGREVGISGADREIQFELSLSGRQECESGRLDQRSDMKFNGGHKSNKTIKEWNLDH